MVEIGRRVPCAGAIVRDGDGRLLLIRRGQEPDLGSWSLPGGRVEAGETAAQAAEREVFEETGLRVRAGALVGSVERPGPGGVTYVIDDFACTVVAGEPRAGDDATEVGWFAPAEARALPLATLVLATLTDWNVL